MNKKVIGAGVAMVIIIGAVLFLALGLPREAGAPGDNEQRGMSAVFDEKNATYVISGVSVALKDGISEVAAAPGSASKVITRYFGNEVRHDFDGDGREDVAFLITQETGGSGTFYYVVGALNTVEGAKGSDAVLLGDRVAPQSTHMGKGNIVVVNYADRKFGEPFSARASEGKTKWLLLDPATMQWGEVEPNFEGEADVAKMSLGMKTWTWVSAEYNNDTQIIPRDPKKFTLAFKSDGTFGASTDCNSIGGNYTLMDVRRIVFDKMFSTEMFCEGSQEDAFKKILSETAGYHFTSRGELILDIKYDSGTATFR